MLQDQEQPVDGDERVGLNRRRVLQGIAATSVVGFGGARTAMPVYAQSDGCACSDATCDVIVPLCAAQTEDVGTVQTQVINTDDGLVLEVRYDLDDGYELDETHLYVGKTCPEELASNPGQFPFSETYDMGVSGDRYLINFDGICEYEIKGGGRGRGGKWETTGNCGFDLGDCVYVAAHAVVVQRNDDGDVTWEETAWGDGCDGTEFSDGGNWATYFSYTSSFCDVFPETIFVGYEDLPEGEGNDYDYNDFLVRLDTEFDAEQTDSGYEVSEIRFDITPRARGAKFEHAFHLLFPPDSLCDGEYDLTVYDDGGNPVSAMTDVAFSGDSDTDIVVFDDTGDVFPDQTNTRQVNDCVAPSQTAELTMTFDDACPFDIDGLEPTAPNGGGLFFDPYITVNQTGETISAGDIRLLTVPDTWLWPQERNPIWEVYDEVDDDGTGQPVFTTETWFDGGFDTTSVYDRC
jgi:LruC domain-containing protein